MQELHGVFGCAVYHMVCRLDAPPSSCSLLYPTGCTLPSTRLPIVLTLRLGVRFQAVTRPADSPRGQSPESSDCCTRLVDCTCTAPRPGRAPGGQHGFSLSLCRLESIYATLTCDMVALRRTYSLTYRVHVPTPNNSATVPTANEQCTMS